MKENSKKSGNSTNNSGNAETNNVYKEVVKTAEQLNSTAQKWNERAESGQTITFTKAEQKKASSDAKNADKDGFLPGVFWTGYIVTTDGEKHEFSRLDANGICRTFESVCTWKRATRGTLLDGNSTRTAEQRADDATTAIDTAKGKPAEKSVTAMLWELATGATIRINSVDTPLLDELKRVVITTMEKADITAAEKAKSKESKTAQRERELEEAKQAAAAATTATESAIKLLLATGQYKTEEEVRKALGL
jgi:hypothetical protein